MVTPIIGMLDFEDPLLHEVRAVKEAVSARAQHDVAKLCAELRQDQEKSGRRVVRRTRKVIQGAK